MKIGIIGLGSIGQRHARCLLRAGVKDIIALRTRQGSVRELPEELSDITQVFRAEEFYSEHPDGIVISNPTSLHAAAMAEALARNIPILVEKPLSDRYDQLEAIMRYDLSKVMVGYCLRYHDLINEVRQWLESKRLGEILKADLYCGQYLPLWHPKVDYRREYYARRDLGGGALRTLSHEIDLMHYLIGLPVALSAVVEKISDLEIDVDDHVRLTCRMASGLTVHIELDYLNPVATRTGHIFGTKGSLSYSFSEAVVRFTDPDGRREEIISTKDASPDLMYDEQMKRFLSLLRRESVDYCSFEDGVNVMRIISAAEESSLLKTWVSLRGESK